MMKTVVVLVLALAVCLHAYSPEHTGDKWQKQSKETKQNTLNGQCLANKTPFGWYSTVRIAEMFVEDMNSSFDSVMDDMPSQALGLEERPKVIHTVGVIAKAQWISTGNHTYTGIFKGSNACFLRASHAKKPIPSPANTVPGISMKFLRDNVPSANLFAMYSLEGQTSFNFFEHDLTNHVPDLNEDAIDFALKQLKKAFMKASKWPTMLGLNQMATFDEDGNAENSPNFPFRLVFHPTKEAHTKFPSTPNNDELYLTKQLDGYNPGKLFDVYAQADPTADLEKIAEVHTTTPFSGTNYGDENMFFQHTRMEADVQFHPEWTDDIEAILAHQRSVAHYTFPDLPWN